MVLIRFTEPGLNPLTLSSHTIISKQFIIPVTNVSLFSSRHILPGSLVLCIEDPKNGKTVDDFTLSIAYIASSSTKKTSQCTINFLFSYSFIFPGLINMVYVIFTNRILSYGSYEQTRVKATSYLILF